MYWQTKTNTTRWWKELKKARQSSEYKERWRKRLWKATSVERCWFQSHVADLETRSIIFLHDTVQIHPIRKFSSFCCSSKINIDNLPLNVQCALCKNPDKILSGSVLSSDWGIILFRLDKEPFQWEIQDLDRVQFKKHVLDPVHIHKQDPDPVYL